MKRHSSLHINPKVDSPLYWIPYFICWFRAPKAEFLRSDRVISMNFGVSKSFYILSYQIHYFLGILFCSISNKNHRLVISLFFLYDKLSWSGDKALKELQEANVSLQSFPILQECAKKVLKLSVPLISRIFYWESTWNMLCNFYGYPLIIMVALLWRQSKLLQKLSQILLI